MFTKNLLEILAASLLLLIILPFFSKVIYPVDFILFEKSGFKVAQNILFSVITFKSKFS